MKHPRDKQPDTWRLFKHKGFLASCLALVVVIAIAAVIYFCVYPLLLTSARESRINSIFNSLHLSNGYLLQRSEVFGDKRLYESDSSRSHSSYKKFIRAADVKTTVTEVKKAIEDAGFTYFDEPYPGSLQVQYHFKSQRNEYIRMTVSSKPRDDAIQNKAMMKLPLTDTEFGIDGNMGPSNVVIKVNLDDNNE